MNPIDDRDDFLPNIEPSAGFAAGVLDRVAEMEALRGALRAEERQSTSLLAIAAALGGSLLGVGLVSLLLPPLLALRVTAHYALDWLRVTAPSTSVPVLAAGGVAAAAIWLACEYVPLLRAARQVSV